MAFKNMAEEINKIESFKFKIKKLVYIKVLDAELKEIINDEKCKNDKREYIFAFDDERKEGIKSKIIPLYIFEKKNFFFSYAPFFKGKYEFFGIKKINIFFCKKLF